MKINNNDLFLIRRALVEVLDNPRNSLTEKYVDLAKKLKMNLEADKR